MDRSSYRYAAVADGDAELREKLLELACQKPRYRIGDCTCCCSAKDRR